MESSVATVRLSRAIVPLTGNANDHNELFEMIGNAPIVLIGEATHGTHEFYHLRAELTKRLIVEKDFTAVCIEGDWPDAYRVNRFVRGTNDDREAVDSLDGFKRFPTWMWRNTDVLDFVGCMREYNDTCRAPRPKVGFYGLDLYSMYASIEAVLGYLDRVDTPLADRAREHYSCLDSYASHPEAYGVAALTGAHPSCREDVVEALMEIQRSAARFARLDGQVAADQYFYAEQNARIVARAERYYRAMIDDSVSTWNLRDAHMADTVERLMLHLASHQGPTKAVVWAHNSHVGDAEATSMILRRETNIGALLRERHGHDAVSVGFTTYSGTVTAASDWHAPEERKRVLPARPDSYEHLFHELGVPRFLLPLRPHRPHLDGLPRQLRERAIGVVYRPQSELASHYFTARLMQQFDAVYHIDLTRAVEPLEHSERWSSGEPPETYPTGE
ncbi:MAG TPA: erythromycin esterase family protein [Candidatus Acidoferrales bacterium]|nr:erythromycin esterase family protein [Candidatus Acidoferrales bacterium]